MSKILGSAYEVGKTEGVISRLPKTGDALEEGKFFRLVNEGKEISLASGSSYAIGVIAQKEVVAVSGLISGLRVAVQWSDGGTPENGNPVYIDAATSKATVETNAGANTLTSATFTGVTGTDGISNNTDTKSTSISWAEINMPNGL
tara:strand:- start:3244 stop:3681 length:438 start_codon:yes stop_codon:yes gene_type:complete